MRKPVRERKTNEPLLCRQVFWIDRMSTLFHQQDGPRTTQFLRRLLTGDEISVEFWDYRCCWDAPVRVQFISNRISDGIEARPVLAEMIRKRVIHPGLVFKHSEIVIISRWDFGGDAHSGRFYSFRCGLMSDEPETPVQGEVCLIDIRMRSLTDSLNGIWQLQVRDGDIQPSLPSPLPLRETEFDFWDLPLLEFQGEDLWQCVARVWGPHLLYFLFVCR